MPNYFAIRADVIREPSASAVQLDRLREDDEVVVFHRSNGDVFFTATTTVLSAASDGNDGYKPPVFAELHPFKKQHPLSILSGSLHKVYRWFLQPERHFRRRVIWLDYDDFEVIRTGVLNIERSTFRYLFSALPFQMQSDFVSRYFDPSSMSEQGDVLDYRRLADAIVHYLESEVVGPLNMVRDSAEHFERLRDVRDLPRLQQLVLSDESGRETLPIGNLITHVAIAADNPIFYDDAKRSLLVRAKELANGGQLSRGDTADLSVKDEIVKHLQSRIWRERIF